MFTGSILLTAFPAFYKPITRIQTRKFTLITINPQFKGFGKRNYQKVGSSLSNSVNRILPTIDNFLVPDSATILPSTSLNTGSDLVSIELEHNGLIRVT